MTDKEIVRSESYSRVLELTELHGYLEGYCQARRDELEKKSFSQICKKLRSGWFEGMEEAINIINTFRMIITWRATDKPLSDKTKEYEKYVLTHIKEILSPYWVHQMEDIWDGNDR